MYNVRLSFYVIGWRYIAKFKCVEDLEHYLSMLRDIDKVIIFDRRLRFMRHYTPMKSMNVLGKYR